MPRHSKANRDVSASAATMKLRKDLSQAGNSEGIANSIVSLGVDLYESSDEVRFYFDSR